MFWQISILVMETRFWFLNNRGGTNANSGTATSWSASTAGLLMECSNYTEICGHDARTRVMEFYLDFILVEIKYGEQQRHRLRVAL